MHFGLELGMVFRRSCIFIINNFGSDRVGGYPTKFYNTGRLRSEVQTLALLYIYHFDRKGTPFIYLP